MFFGLEMNRFYCAGPKVLRVSGRNPQKILGTAKNLLREEDSFSLTHDQRIGAGHSILTVGNS
jgi:hypothetical protein